MTIIKLGKAEVELGPDWTRTTIDGQVVSADHAPQVGQAETAALQGLTAEELNRGHDLTHSLLAALLGLPASPALSAVSRGEVWESWWREEAAVLALQGFAKAAGVDLIEVAKRHDRKQRRITRSAVTGRFVSKEEAAADPDRHVVENR